MSIRFRLIVALALLAILVLGTGAYLSSTAEPRITGASNETFMASLATMRSRLPTADRAGFDEAVATLLAGRVSGMAATAVREGEVSADLRARLDGKTAPEVLVLAAEFRVKAKAEAAALAKRLREQSAALVSEIAPLGKLRAEDAVAARELAKIAMSNTTVTQREWNPQIGKIMTLHLTIRNDSDLPVSRAIMTGTITTEGRAAPWLVADFSWDFKGGLQPGKEETLHLNPGSFNEQPRLEVTPAMRLSVRLSEWIGPDGAIIAKLKLGDDERKRLDALEGELADVQKRLAALALEIRR